MTNKLCTWLNSSVTFGTKAVDNEKIMINMYMH